MIARLLPVALAAVVLAGCGATTSSSEEFQGTEGAVAQAIEDLQQAGQSRNPEDICGDILSRELVDSLEEDGGPCAQEIGKAIDDADDFELEVRDVVVRGGEATARVQRGEDGPTATLELSQEDGRWRVSSLGAG